MKIQESCIEQDYIDNNCMEHVGKIKELTTVEAIEAECTECIVCYKRLADVGAPRTEPAVKTICGHFFGGNCLQKCVDMHEGNEDDFKCPYCRTCLFIGEFPLDMQGPLRDFVECLRGDQLLDEEVDRFLPNAKEADLGGCYGTESGVMLEKLPRKVEKAEKEYEILAGIFAHVF